MPSGLSLTLLGGLHIALDGEPMEDRLTSKAAALLVYLVVTGEPCSRTALAGLLWGESPEGKARASLRTALAALNRHLAPYLRAGRQRLAFDPAHPYWADVLVFREGLGQLLNPQEGRAGELSAAGAARMQELVDLYQGDFLAGNTIDDAPLFEEWLIGERERFRQLALRSLYLLSVHYTAAAAYPLGIRSAERLLALAPWQEEAHRQLMRLLALDGQRSAALAQYEVCRRLLAEELGIAPTAETTALYEQIQRGELARPAAPAHRPAHNLPGQMTPFIGREDELARLQARLAGPAQRLVTIVGPGGVGKTRLALAGAERMLNQFVDGVWWVPLADVTLGTGVEPSEVSQSLASGIAHALGLTFSGEQPLTEQLIAYLHEKQLLLVLDNLEHLLAGVDFLIEMLQRAPQVKMLVTSRERLNLQAEHALGLKGLPVPGGADEAGASGYDGVRLFAERAERTPAGFVLDEGNLPDVIRICALVDGLPLGIELAATWVERLGCASIAETIVQQLDFMETSLRDVPQRHRSMRAVFEGSWQLLNGEEKVALAHCAVFRGGFSAEAAGAVAGADTATLAVLAAKSLLGRPAAGRYAMHDLLRQFALEKLGNLVPAVPFPLPLPTEGGAAEGVGGVPAGGGEVYARHSAYYIDWLVQQEEKLRGQQERRAIAAIQRDWGNIQQAWRWAAEQGPAAAIQRGSRVLAAFFQLNGLLQEGTDLFVRTAGRLQPLLAAPEARLALAAVRVEQAGLLNAQGWSEQAVAAARQAVQLAQDSQATELEAGAHLQRSLALARRMDYAGARHSGRLAQTLAREAGSRQIEAGSHLVLGQIEHATGDYGVAQVYYEEALRLYRQEGDPRGEGAALIQMGTLATDQADLAMARNHYERAREVFHGMVARHQEGAVLESLGRVAAREGDYATARTFYEQALAISSEIGDRRAEGNVLGDTGALLAALGQYDRARAAYEQALNVWREIGYRQGEARVLTGMGCAAGRHGGCATAEGFARQALVVARESEDRSEQARAAHCLGYALAGQDRWDEAAAAYWTALAQRRELGEQAVAVESLAGQASVALARGDMPQAQAHVVEVLSYLERVGSFSGAEDELGIYLVCYRVLQAIGDPRARPLLAAAHRLLGERAARIRPTEYQRSFLEDVAVNREIARLWAGLDTDEPGFQHFV